MPGGFGTLDEGLEVLTLLQTGKHDMMPVVLLDEPDGDYWSTFEQFVRHSLLRTRHDRTDDLSLFAERSRSRTPSRKLRNSIGLSQHALRARRSGVRLERPPSDLLLEELNDTFGDILLDGRFASRGPLPEERDDVELADMPRLVFRFNRRSYAACGS